MKPDRETLTRAIRKAKFMADDEPLTHSDLERIDKEIREERVSEMEEAFERVFEKLIDRYASELGWWTLKKLGMFVVVVLVAAASMVLYFKFPKP